LSLVLNIKGAVEGKDKNVKKVVRFSDVALNELLLHVKRQNIAFIIGKMCVESFLLIEYGFHFWHYDIIP